VGRCSPARSTCCTALKPPANPKRPVRAHERGETGGPQAGKCRAQRERNAEVPTYPAAPFLPVRSRLESLPLQIRGTLDPQPSTLAIAAPVASPICLQTMAASTATPIATSSPLTSMNPTSTEHDYRFPRRPGAPAATGAPRSFFAPHYQAQHHQHQHQHQHQHGTNRESSGGLRAELQGLQLDFTTPAYTSTIGPYPSTRDELLRSSAFLPFQRGVASGLGQSPEEMQRQDPIAIQVWRFFADTKKRLPEQDRMENLTWRMMHMTLRKRRQAEAARYDLALYLFYLSDIGNESFF